MSRFGTGLTGVGFRHRLLSCNRESRNWLLREFSLWGHHATSFTGITGRLGTQARTFPLAENDPQGITVDSTNGDVLIVGKTRTSFTGITGRAWDSGTDVPAAETFPNGDNG